jgi:putative ABC transport system permease protein
VQQAEGARTTGLRVKTGAGEWIAITINALGDIQDQHVDQVKLVQGTWPPADREIVLEFNKFKDTQAGVGDSIEIELPSGKTRSIKVVGIVQDQTIGSNGIGGGFFLAPVQGYITQDTLEWFELPSTFNQVYVTVTGDRNDLPHIQQVADRVRGEVENSSQLVVNTILRRSTDHPLTPYIDAI